MTTIDGFVSVTQTALNGVALLLAGVALLAWGNHLLLAGTPTSMAHALLWTVVSVAVLLGLAAAERLAGV